VGVISLMTSTHATATLPKYLLFGLSIGELDECFAKYEVSLRAVKLGDEFISLKIYGAKSDIQNSVKKLYNLINNYYRMHLEDKMVAQNIPENLNESLYGYEKLAEKYINYCEANDINPHPEVI
jgi:hypothetical protein